MQNQHTYYDRKFGILTDIAPLLTEEAEALDFLLPLSKSYPEIESWYVQKVVPGLRIGTRTLLRIVRDDRLVGLGIAKNEDGERKICTVRIAPTHVGRGIGLRIFDGLLNWLEDDQPHLTIGADKLPAFERIFDYYKFSFTFARPGLYLPQSVELSYNDRAGDNVIA